MSEGTHHPEAYQDTTVETYDKSAKELAEYFKGIGARTEDIERGLTLATSTSDARVIEIGCGDGRDAAEIIKRVGWYRGVDPSKGLLDIARETVPNASFVQGNAQTYEYPRDIDVIYAFASLLHVPKEELHEVFERASLSLRTGGIFYLSLKKRAQYEKEVKKDAYGERTFYFYTPDTIRERAGDTFESVYEDHQRIGDTNWFSLALRKK